MNTFGKEIIERFKEENNLEDFCHYVYEFYGTEPLSSWFAKDKKSVFYCSDLWNVFETSSKETTSLGAFLLLAELSEENPPVHIEFAQRALNIWCKRNFNDDKVLAYVFNRFPYNRAEWLDLLKQYNRLNNEVISNWAAPALETALHLCTVLMKGEKTCTMIHVDAFLPSKLDQSLYLFTKQFIGIMNHSEQPLDKHFIDEMFNAISNHELKISSRMFAIQILTSKKVTEQIDKSFISNTFLHASINAPFPLGGLLYNLSKQYNHSQENQTIPFKAVARSNRYMNEEYGQISVDSWKEIIQAFHTEIKKGHSLKELQNFPDFTNDMIVRELFHKTKMESPIDPFALCDKLNILVKQIDLPSNIEAFIIKSELADKGMIVLNQKKIKSNRIKFTLAHELGHLIKHPFPNGVNVLVDEKVEMLVSEKDETVQHVNLEWEREANDFAQHLLVPRGSIEEKHLINIQNNFVQRLMDLSNRWKVSMGVLASKIVSVTKLEMILIISENGDIVFSQTSPYWEGDN
ncbi:ImmA/IrrE family metallo-endopeptidase, partial [Neobacillus niacini]|uniref:ImmA/IrrE family metallo-endopeptidase n=1 Tax=Neobacillus niacini TaxID=86668 RepID=UPI0030029A76